LPAQLAGNFGFRSGNVGLSYTNALFPGLLGAPGAPGVWPAGPGVCAGLLESCVGLTDLCAGLDAPGTGFIGHCGPIIGLKFGDSGFAIISPRGCITCLDFSILPGLACSFR
jgi:hypothetical protein